MKTKLYNMLVLQDRLNQQIDPDWRSAHHAWYRAIWVECAELLEHYGWKWWKAQSRDHEQIRLELIDIWHFGLSAELARHSDHQHATHALLNALQHPLPHLEDDFRLQVEALATHALTHKALHVGVFMKLLQKAGSNFDDLYRIYIGKNVLNRFRQDHGYQQGHYLKQWHGREDNAVLAELANQLDADDPQFPEQLYRALENHYPQSPHA